MKKKTMRTMEMGIKRWRVMGREGKKKSLKSIFLKKNYKNLVLF